MAWDSLDRSPFRKRIALSEIDSSKIEESKAVHARSYLPVGTSSDVEDSKIVQMSCTLPEVASSDGMRSKAVQMRRTLP